MMKDNNNYIAKIIDTLLAMPGMNDNVKVELKLPRKSILMISKLIEGSLTKEQDVFFSEMLSLLPEETKSQLASVPAELLKKSGLTELNEKLNQLK